ncbi:uncharacterized protein GJ701_000847 [Geothlypis trichas]
MALTEAARENKKGLPVESGGEGGKEREGGREEEDSRFNQRKIKSKNNLVCVPPPVAFFVQFQQSCEEVAPFVPLFIDCVNIAKRRRRSGGTYSSPRGGGGRYRGGGAGRGGTGRASPASTSDFSALPHPPTPPRPREEPGGGAAAAAGRTAPLPRPAAAAQHRPAGGEARRAEPSGGATGRGGPAARLGADRLAGILRLPVEPVASPSAGSSEGRCTLHSAPFSLRDTQASEGSGRAGSCGSQEISLFSRSPLNIAVNALAVLVIRLQLLLLLLVK